MSTCRRCKALLRPGVNWHLSYAESSNRLCKACLIKKNKAHRDANGGFTNRLQKRLYDEDPWLYQCYAMLGRAGISRTEETARRLYNEVLPRNHVCTCCGTAMVTTAGQVQGQGKCVNPRPDSPSLEHVIPRSRYSHGEVDEWETLRIICFQCNTDLKNHTPARLRQLRLASQ